MMQDGQVITHDTLFEPVETSENLSNESGQTLDPKIVSITPKVETEVPVETTKENVTDETKELSKDDEPKSTFDEKHFQRIADQRLTELTKIKLEKERLEAEFNALKNPPKPAPEPITEPIEPVMPQDYDPLDVFTKGTTSYEYDQANKKYLKDLAKYTSELAKELKTEKQKLEQVNQASQAKAKILSEYTSRGKSIEEAQKIYEWTNGLFSPEGFTPERVMAFYEFENSRPNAQTQLKSNQIDQRNEKSKMLPPLYSFSNVSRINSSP